MPKVSVIIPSYNCEKYIAETIESVLHQTFDDFEIIIIDGSTDNTKNIIAGYISGYPGKIRYFYQYNRGVSAARNFGIKESKGDYIAFLDADDTWVPDKLKLQIELMKKYPGTAMIFTDGTSFNEKGIIKHSLVRPVNAHQIKENFKKRILLTEFNDGTILKCDLFRDLLFENYIPTFSVLLTKDCLGKTGYFNENLQISEDYELWIRVAQIYPILYLNKVTGYYRIRDDGLSGKIGVRLQRWQKWKGKMLEMFIKNYKGQHKKLIKNRIVECYQDALDGYMHCGDMNEVRSLCLRILMYDKVKPKVYLYILTSLLPTQLLSFARKLTSHKIRMKACNEKE